MTIQRDSREPPFEDRLGALVSSTRRLRSLVEHLPLEDLRRPAYPSEWTIAQVLSHLGSGAVIAQLRLEAALSGSELSPDVQQSIWDTWNAKAPTVQRHDALAADRSLLARLVATTGDERARFRTALGPLELDLGGFVGLRLNEHALHTWDIDVVSDPAAAVPPDVAALILDTLSTIAGFAGRPTGARRTIAVRVNDPARAFEVVLRPDGVAVTALDVPEVADLELPAEAFIRLVYGRLDPNHTPHIDGDPADLDQLRRAFPGI